jgi:MFS family permease
VDAEGNPNTNIYNWFVKLGLVCDPNSKKAVSLIATVALLGISLSCLIIPRMGDLYGRKPLYVFALCLQIPVYIAFCIWKTMIPIYITAFLLGPCVTGRLACGYLLLLEMVPKRN